MSSNVTDWINITLATTQRSWTNVTITHIEEETKGTNVTSAVDHCLVSGCVLSATLISLIAIIGIIANTAVIVIVSLYRKLRTPTYTAITCLSISDLTFLLTRYPLFIIRSYFKDVLHITDFKIVNYLLGTLVVISGLCSILHLVFLMFLRYAMVVHPLTSHVFLTNKKVICGSLVGWALSLAIGLFYMFAAVLNRSNNPLLAHYANISVTVIMSVVPIVLIILFHLLKANALRRSLVSCTEDSIKAMSRTITLVIVAFVITTLPVNTRDILEISFDFETERWFIVFSIVSNILLYVNYAVNPFIYFFTNSLHKKLINRARTQSWRLSDHTFTTDLVGSLGSHQSKPNKERKDM